MTGNRSSRPPRTAQFRPDHRRHRCRPVRLLLPWLLSRAFPLWPWIGGGLLGGIGLLIPAALGPVYKVWMKFGHVMGAINTRLILGLFFYLIVTPFGFVMRLFRWDPMRRRRVEGDSYRVTSHANSTHGETLLMIELSKTSGHSCASARNSGLPPSSSCCCSWAR
jgi:hypothetical protein